MKREICLLAIFGFAFMVVVGCGGSSSVSISGTVTDSGAALSGVTVVLSGVSSATATTDKSGNYSFADLADGNYTITPAKATYTFIPTNSAQTVKGASIPNIDFSGTSTLTQGLLAYYPFNGNANDASGNGNNGTAHGAALAPDRFNNPNSAYDFNGTTDYISVPHSDSLNLTSSYSFSVWIFQRTAVPVGYRILDKTIAGSCGGWTFDTTDNSTGRRITMDVGCPWVTSSTEYSLNQWHHILGTVNGSNVILYLDGQQDGSGSIGGTPTNTLDLYIGAAHPVSYYFDGLLDDIRIYNRVLSSAEVQALYTQ